MTSLKNPPRPARKIPVKKTDTAQKERFIKTAKELDGDESPEAYDRVFKAKAKQGKSPKSG